MITILSNFVTTRMKIFNKAYNSFKFAAIVSATAGISIILCTVAGHFISPGKLIPFAMVGGALGILTGIYFLLKQGLVERRNVVEVFVTTLIAFGFISLLLIFNLDKPFLIIAGMFFIGLTATFSNDYFQSRKDMSVNRRYGVLGLILVFPVFYFCVSSILKFSLGISAPFSIIEGLLKSPHGQANFNAITPFIFGGGLVLSVIINLFALIKPIKSNGSFGQFTINRTMILSLNFAVLIMSCALSLTLLIYLFLENY
jgi:hypothetical protein